MCYQSDKPRAYAGCIQFGVGAWQKKADRHQAITSLAEGRRARCKKSEWVKPQSDRASVVAGRN